MYEANPQNIHDLKTAITTKIISIPTKKLIHVIDNFTCLILEFLHHNGEHLEYIFEQV